MKPEHGIRRVLCLGATGSGKSTLAGELGRILGLPVHYVDVEIGWLPGWTSRPAAEQRELALRIAAEPAWVFDSVYRHYRQDVAERAELIVCLDYPRVVSLGRLLVRSVRRAATGQETCNGNRETWARLLGKESIIRWHFSTFASKRRQIRGYEQSLDPVRVKRFTLPRETRKWLAWLEAGLPGSNP